MKKGQITLKKKKAVAFEELLHEYENMTSSKVAIRLLRPIGFTNEDLLKIGFTKEDIEEAEKEDD